MSSVRSTSLGSGNTATVTVDVWTRPRFSFGGMRCQRCPPGSVSSSDRAPRPVMRNATNPSRSSRSTASKRPPPRDANVDGHLLAHERLCVVTALGGAYLEDHAVHIVLSVGPRLGAAFPGSAQRPTTRRAAMNVVAARSIQGGRLDHHVDACAALSCDDVGVLLRRRRHLS